MKFHDVLATLHRSHGRQVAEIPRGWMQGRTVFGGLQAALAVRAMRGVVDAALPLRSLHATFVAPLHTGQVQLRTELLRTGKSATHATCNLLLEDGGIACTTVGIFGAARPSGFARAMTPPEAGVDPETLPDTPQVPGLTPTFLQHFQMRWARGMPPFTGYHEPRTLIFGRLREAGCTPEEALVALADLIPTPVVSMLRRPAPTSSLNWMLEPVGDARTFDPTRWCLIDTEVRAGGDGYLSQTSVLYGAGGHAGSVSHQSVAIFG